MPWLNYRSVVLGKERLQQDSSSKRIIGKIYSEGRKYVQERKGFSEGK
jgi:hypothetical protein